MSDFLRWDTGRGRSITLIANCAFCIRATALERFTQSFGADTASIKAFGLDVVTTCANNCKPVVRRACIFTP